MENKNFVNVLAFTMSFFILSFSCIFIFSKKDNFSEYENRYLEDFPNLTVDSLIDGKYMLGLKNYTSDYFPFRNNFMGFKTNFEKLVGKTEINDVYIGTDEYLIEKYLKPVNTDRIINKLNSFYKSLNSKNIALLLAPTSITINSDKLPNYVVPISQLETLNKIYQSVGYQNINVYDVFMKNKSKYDLYYRLDHHWTTYGAYLAYVEYCHALKITPMEISEFVVKEVSNNFNGTLYSKTNDYSLTPDKMITFTSNNKFTINYVNSKRITNSFYEEKYLNQKDKYAYFLDGNRPLIEITNETIKSNQELVIIKDSYANSLIPFLANHYKKIHVIDPRFYKASISDYINQKKIDNVLLIYNMNTLDNDLGIMSIK